MNMAVIVGVAAAVVVVVVVVIVIVMFTFSECTPLFCVLYQMCGIDKQQEGTLPAYVFSLLAIYYLQQCTPPVLPVLHEVLP